ncbi:hypothetical protein G6011_01124 [Alternaria panax]|uniref:F-box domain-containing protein n=1 Tax=Alternaria panax TaxID=48097 RepID=A0AAD4IKB7_9PLEO|nr:hypothetical protein G6011_01124 [Alternaria panax]
MKTENASLDGLPDELVLEILSYLMTARSYETQSTDFKNKEKEKKRQFENRARQQSLRSVCLTSRHMNRIAAPILYASFTGAATRHGLEPLKLFHQRTVASDISNNKRIEYLQYVEVRLEDDQGNSLHADTFEAGTVYQAAHYFRLLAEVINRARNLQHLSLVILETDSVSFWKHIITVESTTAALTQMTVAGHGFDKLRTVCLQMHISLSIDHSSGSFDQICSVMSRAPLLSDFRAHGVAIFALPDQLSELGTFSMPKRMELTESMLEMGEIAKILWACKELRRVVCTWAFLDHGSGTPRDLYIALLRHNGSLESLHLDFREVRSAEDLDESQCFGTLLPFNCLKTLAISENGFLGLSAPFHAGMSPGPGQPTKPPLPSMAKLLPQCLTSFAMLIGYDLHGMPFPSPDESCDLWDWAAEYASSNLNLERFSVNGDFNGKCARYLTDAFLDMGVEFEVNDFGRT